MLSWTCNAPKLAGRFQFCGLIVVQCGAMKHGIKQYVALLCGWLAAGYLLSGCGQTIAPTPVVTPTATPAPIAETRQPTATQPPTATPRRATPIPSPTATVSPTPVVYTIQSGDTLLKVAIQFDVSTEALQEANGIVDPRFLQIGQTLIIPPSDQDSEIPPTPTPTPFPLNVTTIHFQKTRQGTLWGLGSVTNPGRAPLTDVVIEASLLDADGLLLAREAAFTQLDVVPPGKSAPFAILFENPPDSFAQYQVIPVAAVPMSDQTRYYFDLEPFDLFGTAKGQSTYRVRGQIRNTGSADVESVRLVVVAYDDENRVLAQRQADLAVNLLKPTAATPFEIDLIIAGGTVDHFDVLAQGLRVE